MHDGVQGPAPSERVRGAFLSNSGRPLASPRGQRLERVIEAHAVLGQGVLDAGRHLVVGHTAHDAVRFRSGDYTEGVVSSLAMQVAGTQTFLSTAEQQGVSPELLGSYFELMRRRLAQGSGEEGLAGVIDLLVH